MSPRVYRLISEPIRENPSFEERWKGSDNGLIMAWEVGREKSIISPKLAGKAKNGELPKLGWKGGIKEKEEEEEEMKEKFGSLFYLAQWQGLRGEDLNIDLSVEPTITCSKTGVKVTFTTDSDKF